MTNLHFWYCKPNSYKCGKVVTTPICKYKCLPLQCQRSHICFSLLHVQLDYCVKQLQEKMSVPTHPLLFCTFPKANKQIVNCPTRWSLFFIFVFLCWSSTNKYQKYKSVELGDQLTNKGSISLISLFSQIWPHLLEFSFFSPSNLVRLLQLDMRLSPICQSSFTDLSEPTTSGWIVKLVKVIGYHGFNLEHIQK